MAEKTVKTFKLADGSIVKFEKHESLESTAQLAKSYANAGYPNKYVIFTENQTKNSASDKQMGIFLSCILRPSFFPSQAGLLAPLSAAALLTALEEHTASRLGIGWLSDIYCAGKRIGGVTIEGKLDSFSSYEYLIVSFTVLVDKKDFPPRLGDMIRQVFEGEHGSITEIIAKTILQKFFSAYTGLKTPGKYMDVYSRRFILTDKRIKYIKDGKKLSCRVVGIDRTTCALIVDIGKGETLRVTSPSGVVIPSRISF